MTSAAVAVATLALAAFGASCTGMTSDLPPTGGGAAGGGKTGVGGGASSTGGGSSTGTGGGTASAGGGSAGTGGGSSGGGASAGGGSSGGGASFPPYDGGCWGIAVPRGTGGPSGGAVGMWANVTPSGVTLDTTAFGGDNYGAQDVLVDPARPSDLYAFFTHQGVYKSTDYGQTWAKVNTGMNGAAIDSGKPWGEAIDTNRCRDPNTPPTLYLAGSQNRFWRSKDGAVSWQPYDLPDDGKARPQDLYDVDADPYDGQHLIAGFHEESGLVESTNGGETWHAVTLDPGMASGTSWYAFFIDTGNATTTRQTWLMLSQTTGTVGTWRTANGGSTWTKVENNEHNHGGSQLYQHNGVVYMAGVYGTQGWGVYRSTDFGVMWTHLSSGGGLNIVYGTDNYVYSQSAPFGNQAVAERAPQPGTSWSIWPLTLPDGPKRAAVTHDGAHFIIVGGNWSAGLWRYVEP